MPAIYCIRTTSSCLFYTPTVRLRENRKQWMLHKTQPPGFIHSLNFLSVCFRVLAHTEESFSAEHFFPGSGHTAATSLVFLLTGSKMQNLRPFLGLIYGPQEGCHQDWTHQQMCTDTDHTPEFKLENSKQPVHIRITAAGNNRCLSEATSIKSNDTSFMSRGTEQFPWFNRP